jgi:hypothetical protein
MSHRAAEQRDELAPSHVGHGLPLPGVSTGNQRTAQSAYRTLSLPRKHQQVLGAGLNRKTRKSGNCYGGSPSTRDKLASGFVEALEKDWAEHGSEVIQQIRLDNPVKYGELIARLVPMDANLPSANDFPSCQSMEDIGRKLLKSVGRDEATDDMVELAIKANDAFIAELERIAQGN